MLEAPYKIWPPFELLMPQQIFLLAGITSAEHLFDKLSPLLPDATIVRWIEPLPEVLIPDYSERLAASIDAPSDVPARS